MRAWSRAVALVAAAAGLAAGCAQTIGFNECGTSCSAADLRAGKCDSECARFSTDGGAAYCTTDHLCVAPLPSERLCADSAGAPVGAAGNLVVASLLDRNDTVDKSIERAYLLALGEINARQNGAGQPPIELHLCDTASDPAQALRAARWAVDTYHAAAFLGPTTSGAVVNITSFVKSAGVLVISPSATAIDISSLASDHLVWRTAPSDALQSVLLAKVIKLDKPSPTKVDTLYVNNVYGKGLSVAFNLEYTKAGGQVSREVQYANAAGLKDAVNTIAKDAPSHALIVVDADAPAVLKQVESQPGLGATQLFMTDAAKGDSLFPAMPTAADKAVLARIRGTAPANPMNAEFDIFRQSFKSMYGNADPAQSAFTANAYDATYLVAIAAAATSGHVPSGRELAAGLGRVRSGCDHSTGLAVGSKDYLKIVAQVAKDMVCLDGAAGPIEFDMNGDPRFGAFEYWGIDTTGPNPRFVTLPIPTQ